MIAKIERVHLRSAFPHEAYDFTTWLKNNLDVLNDALDIELVSAEREQAAGDFSVDLVAEDKAGNKVIIENQLERSNHDHLGKVLTYLVAVQATTAIWIVSDPRPEHVGVINWLNESSSADFYLFKLEAVRIGDSLPAPLLTRIVGPSEVTRAAGRTKQEFSERHSVNEEFWRTLIAHAKTKTNLLNGRTSTIGYWVGIGAGRPGFYYHCAVYDNSTLVDMYLDMGKEAGAENKAAFDLLLSKKAEIESIFGGLLHWKRLNERRACRIGLAIENGGRADRERWDEIAKGTVDVLIRLDRALRPFIQSLDIHAPLQTESISTQSPSSLPDGDEGEE